MDTFANQISAIVVQNLRSEFEKVNKQLVTLETKINNIEKENAILNTDNKNLRSKLNDLEQQIKNKNIPEDSGHNHQFDEIVQEINEREKRKRNVLIFGISEEHNSGNQTRANQDKQLVNRIFNSISISESENISAIRVGKFDPNKNVPRPLKVTVSDESVVHDIIHKAKNLRSMNNYKNVNISLDRTPRQIELYRAVKGQLSERIAAGETNLRIKYIRGVPKIITLN